MSCSQVVGNTITYEFECSHFVNDVDTLYDPSEVYVSVIKGDGSEDTVRYGGTELNDNHIRRLSTGKYVLSYILDVAGEWRIRSKTVETIAGDDFPSKGKELVFMVDGDVHEFVDTVSPNADFSIIYYGVGVAGITDPAVIMAMNTSDRQEPITLVYTQVITGQKTYVAHPTGLTVSWSANGFPVDELATRSITLTGHNGESATYTLHESTNLLTTSGMTFLFEGY